MFERTVLVDKNLCFVLMPFRSKLDPVYKVIREVVVSGHSLLCVRSDDIYSTGIVIKEVWDNICMAQIVIADATGRNVNVFYEMGLAHALNKTLIIMAQSMKDIPFDLQHRRVLIYSPTKLQELSVKLSAIIGNVKWKPPQINQWISTNKIELRIGLDSPVGGVIVHQTPINANGRLVGLPGGDLAFRIQGFVITDQEYPQASAIVDSQGFWSIDQIHLGTRKHKLFFRIFDEAGRLYAESDTIEVIKES
ncbi:MAG: hypothetical protein GY940_28750 [bacterium]|nr:hypothetical protein [bacterium]